MTTLFVQYTGFQECRENLKAKNLGLYTSLRTSITNLVEDPYRKRLMCLDTMPIKCMQQK